MLTVISGAAGDDRLVTEAFEDKLAKQIFVGRLPHDATPDELKDWAQHLFGSEKAGSAIVVHSSSQSLARHLFFPTQPTAHSYDVNTHRPWISARRSLADLAS